MSRSGIWYTKNVSIKNSALKAPKLFRRASHITFRQCSFCWCRGNIYLDNVSVVGNYVFDGAENIEVHNSTFISKDAFWNCKNVTIYNSIIDGEYLAWNTNNIKFINCKIESDQGLNYIDQLEMKDSSLIHIDLVFEYVSNMDVELNTKIDSVKNPISGKLVAPEISTLIMDPNKIDPAKTTIDCPKIGEIVDQPDMNQEPKD